jgi:putative ABC transport system substrate-binding protein
MPSPEPGGDTCGGGSFSAFWAVLRRKRDRANSFSCSVILTSENPSSFALLPPLELAVTSLRMRSTAAKVKNADQIEKAMSEHAQQSDVGLIVLPGSAIQVHRDVIVALAAQYNLPAVYGFRDWVGAGGLVSYGVVQSDYYRLAASYIDPILKGEKPADLPVQAPTKYELVINLKTAKGLGLTVPPTLLARADEVIE